MTRRDGQFPKVPKLDIDPQVWPENYWNESQVCTECETAWPISHLFRPSVCCDALTHPTDVRPDMRWPEAITRLLTVRFERAYEQYNAGASDEELVLDDSEVTQAVERLIEDSNSSNSTSSPQSASPK